tara:strand:+ start:68 stop:1309 length:1242 start_codon:yes stop_codon:yes gene_type:complete
LLTISERLIIKRYLKPKRKEGLLKIISLFSFIGIGLGVATLIVVMAVMNGFRDELISKLLSFQPHITIEKIKNDQKTFNSVQDILLKRKFDILSISLVQNGKGLILTDKISKGIVFKGFDREYGNFNQVFNKNNILQINDKLNFNDDEVGIGTDLANILNLKLGDEIVILSSKSNTTPIGTIPSSYKFKVSFIFDTGLYEFDSNYIIGNTYQSNNFTNSNFKEIELRLKNINNTKKATNLLKNLFTKKNIYHWSDVNKTFYDALNVERNVMFIILTLIIIVAAFNIISGLTILVKNKSKEIAILKTLGFTDFSICKIFLIIGSSIGICGTVFGSFLGVLISHNVENLRLFLSNVFNLEIFPAEIYFLSKMPANIELDMIILISLFSILISILASLFPAIKASKLDPIINLKYE